MSGVGICTLPMCTLARALLSSRPPPSHGHMIPLRLSLSLCQLPNFQKVDQYPASFDTSWFCNSMRPGGHLSDICITVQVHVTCAVCFFTSTTVKLSRLWLLDFPLMPLPIFVVFSKFNMHKNEHHHKNPLQLLYLLMGSHVIQKVVLSDIVF